MQLITRLTVMVSEPLKSVGENHKLPWIFESKITPPSMNSACSGAFGQTALTATPALVGNSRCPPCICCTPTRRAPARNEV